MSVSNFAITSLRYADIEEVDMAAPPEPTHAPKSAVNLGEAATASSCHLLVLPRELRDEIYEYVVVEEKPINFDSRFNRPCPNQPGILGVCHQIRTEASPLYYDLNSFMFDCGRRALCNVPHLPTTLNQMQHIEIVHYCFLYSEQFTLDISQGLPKYELDFESYGSSSQLPNMVARFEHVKSWLDTSIANGNGVLTAKLFKDLIIDIVQSRDQFCVSGEEKHARCNKLGSRERLGPISTREKKGNRR